MEDGTPNVAHVTHVAPDIAQETLGVTPNVNNVMPIVTAETAQEKCLSSDAAHSLRQISPPCLKVSSNLDNAFVLGTHLQCYWQDQPLAEKQPG